MGSDKVARKDWAKGRLKDRKEKKSKKDRKEKKSKKSKKDKQMDKIKSNRKDRKAKKSEKDKKDKKEKKSSKRNQIKNEPKMEVDSGSNRSSKRKIPIEQGSFAYKYMQNLGWSEGKGLGREKQGNDRAVRAEIKRDVGGIGFKRGPGGDEGFHWWDHVFRQAAGGVNVGDVGEESSRADINFTTKRPETLEKIETARKDNGGFVFGRFVKSKNEYTATKDTKREAPKPEVSDDSSDSDREDDSDDNMRTAPSSSSPIKATSLFGLTDEELLRLCGGRTAHKAARHGLKLSAKLERVARMDAEVKSFDHARDRVMKSSSKSLKVDHDHKKSRHEESNDGISSDDEDQKVRGPRRKFNSSKPKFTAIRPVYHD
eukprot:Clim_evm11s253 gene=Clim_evmTU11s253